MFISRTLYVVLSRTVLFVTIIRYCNAIYEFDFKKKKCQMFQTIFRHVYQPSTEEIPLVTYAFFPPPLPFSLSTLLNRDFFFLRKRQNSSSSVQNVFGFMTVLSSLNIQRSETGRYVPTSPVRGFVATDSTLPFWDT